MKNTIIFIALFLIFCLQIQAEDRIYCYHDGFSVMNKEIELNLKAGTHEYTYDQLPSTVEIRSMVLRGLPDSVKLLMTSNDYEFKKKDYLLNHCEDKNIVYTLLKSPYESFNGNVQKDLGGSLIVDRFKGKPEIIQKEDIDAISIENVEAPLSPEVKLTIYSPNNITTKFYLTYIILGLSWNCCYNFSTNGKELDLDQQIQIINKTDTDFQNIEFCLIDNDVEYRNRDYTSHDFVFPNQRLFLPFQSYSKFEKHVSINLNKQSSQLITIPKVKNCNFDVYHVFKLNKFNNEVFTYMNSLFKKYDINYDDKFILNDSVRSMVKVSIPVLNSSYAYGEKEISGISIYRVIMTLDSNRICIPNKPDVDSFFLKRNIYNDTRAFENHNNFNDLLDTLDFEFESKDVNVEIENIEILDKYVKENKKLYLKITYKFSNLSDLPQKIYITENTVKYRHYILKAKQSKTLKVKCIGWVNR